MGPAIPTNELYCPEKKGTVTILIYVPDPDRESCHELPLTSVSYQGGTLPWHPCFFQLFSHNDVVTSRVTRKIREAGEKTTEKSTAPVQEEYKR
jgi:hypothetical protein